MLGLEFNDEITAIQILLEFLDRVMKIKKNYIKAGIKAGDQPTKQSDFLCHFVFWIQKISSGIKSSGIQAKRDKLTEK